MSWDEARSFSRRLCAAAGGPSWESLQGPSGEGGCAQLDAADCHQIDVEGVYCSLRFKPNKNPRLWSLAEWDLECSIISFISVINSWGSMSRLGALKCIARKSRLLKAGRCSFFFLSLWSQSWTRFEPWHSQSDSERISRLRHLTAGTDAAASRPHVQRSPFREVLLREN